MPAKIGSRTIYTIELKIPCLGVDVTKDVDNKELCVIYHELDDFCKEIANACGAVRLPEYTSPIIRNPSSQASEKLFAYASTVTDFTIKGASEALGIPENTLWTAANKFVKDDTFTRTQVLGGVAHIYALKKKTPIPPKDTPPAITVLPNGKVPFPATRIDPERERMASR